MKKIYRDVKVERYFPDVLAPAKEFRDIAAGEDPEYALIYDAAWKWFANTFIFYTDEDGLERWEDMLNIFPEKDATIEDRRVALYLALNGTLPYTEKAFKNLCDNLYYDNAVLPVVSPNQYTLVINVDSGMMTHLGALFRYARLIVPANLTVQTAHTVDVSQYQYIGAVARLRKRYEVGRKQESGAETQTLTMTAGNTQFQNNRIFLGYVTTKIVSTLPESVGAMTPAEIVYDDVSYKICDLYTLNRTYSEITFDTEPPFGSLTLTINGTEIVATKQKSSYFSNVTAYRFATPYAFTDGTTYPIVVSF